LEYVITMIVDLVQDQALDIFRIGLLIALMFTMLRTRAATGVVIPLIAGIIFVVIIPVTQGPNGAAPMWVQIGTGIIVNAAYVLVGVLISQLVGQRR
jgi:hypothetical protein